MSVGVVRALPPGSPGVPPSVPYVRNDGGYAKQGVCGEEIRQAEIPVELPGCVGAYCTRPQADCDGIHVAHLRAGPEKELFQLIVWGGE
jgi:hypothetical protein